MHAHTRARALRVQVLAVLKTDGMKDGDKKRTIEKLLNTLSSDAFGKMVMCARRITDYSQARARARARARVRARTRVHVLARTRRTVRRRPRARRASMTRSAWR
jgi:hypothetical protein